MKIILYDLTCAQPLSSKFHGAGLYAEALFIKLCDYSKEVHIIALYNKTAILNPVIINKCKINNIELVDIANETYKQVVVRISPDIYITVLPSKDRIVLLKNVQFITVCHDIRTIDCYFDPIYYRFCQNWIDFVFLLDSIFLKGFLAKKNTLLNLKMFIGRENSNFITVSQHTKHHVLSYFPKIKADNIEVFYSPMLEQVNSEKSLYLPLPKVLHKKKYFLMDSGWRWMKNNLRAAIALDQVFSDRPELDFKAVIVGVKSVKPFLSKLKNKDKFVLLGYVDKGLLNTLHRDAYCFIYPSMAEGFGYSPLESMKYEVPVIASSVSSIPEICGDAVLYTNPMSIPEIKNRCLQVLNTEIYNQIKVKCYKQYDKVSMIQKSHLKQLVEKILSY